MYRSQERYRKEILTFGSVEQLGLEVTRFSSDMGPKSFNQLGEISCNRREVGFGALPAGAESGSLFTL
jgi:hypothetical protein